MTPEEALSLGQKAERALQEAVNGVVEEARRTHGSVVVWENGSVRRIPADQLPASEAGPSGPSSEKDGTCQQPSP
jgi:hypothetical protein